MALSLKMKRKLDRFGPFGSGIGSVMGFIVFLTFSDITYHYRINNIGIELLLTFNGAIFAYFLNTCQHRTNIFISKSAFAGSVGSIIGILIIGPLAFVLFFLLYVFAFIPLIIIVFIIPFYLSRSVCRHQEKEFYLWKSIM